MLQKIRDTSQGWIVWVIVIAISLTFALWGVHSYLYSNQFANVVAEVDGEKITQQDLSVVVNQMRMLQQKQSTALPNNVLQQMALQSIVSSVLLNHAASENGFFVSPILTEASIANMPTFQVDGQFSAARFNAVLNALAYSQDQFFDQVRQQILTNQIEDGISQTDFSLQSEVDQSIQLIHQKRNFDYIIIPAKQFISTVQPTSQEIESYYHQQANQFKIPEKVSVDYITLSLNDLMKKIKPTDTELQQYYQNNLTNYIQPKQWQISLLLIPVNSQADSATIQKIKQQAADAGKQMQAGKDVNQLRSQYLGSEAHTTWVNGNQLSSDLQNTLANMQKGAVSSPIQTGAGFEIIKVLDIKPQKIFSFSQAKDKVLAAYKQQKAQDQFTNLSSQLANITYENPDSLKEAAKQLNLTIQTTPLFTSEGGKEGIISNPKIVQAAFSDSVLSQGNNSDPVNLSDTDVVVLRIQQHQLGIEKPLADVKSQIEDVLRKGQANAKAKDEGLQIISLVNQGQPLCQAAKKYKLTCSQPGYVSLTDKSVNHDILMAAFKMPRPAKNATRTNVGVALSTGDYAVISLSDIQYANAASLSGSEKDQLSKAISSSFGSVSYNLYVKGLRDKAKVKNHSNADEENN